MTKNIRWDETQKELMLDFMCTHPEFAAGRLLGPLGRERESELWNRLTLILNARGVGAFKSTEKWIRTWSDWKSNTKQKAAEIARHSTGTGGGIKCPKRLNDLEVRLLDLIGWTTVTGLTTIPEAGLQDTGPAVTPPVLIESVVSIAEFILEVDGNTSPPSGTQPSPSTSDAACKRKDAQTPSGESKRKCVKKTNPKESPYAEAVKSFEEIEDKRSTIYETMSNSLIDIAVSMKTIAEAKTRKAIAVESLAEAKTRKAIAVERIAAAKEAKIKSMNR